VLWVEFRWQTQGWSVKQLLWHSGGLRTDRAITTEAAGQQHPSTMLRAVTTAHGASEGTGGIVTSVPRCYPGRDGA